MPSYSEYALIAERQVPWYGDMCLNLAMWGCLLRVIALAMFIVRNRATHAWPTAHAVRLPLGALLIDPMRHVRHRCLSPSLAALAAQVRNNIDLKGWWMQRQRVVMKFVNRSLDRVCPKTMRG